MKTRDLIIIGGAVVGGGFILAKLFGSASSALAGQLADKLADIMPAARDQDIADFAAPIANAMRRFGITSPREQAAFLAQIAHESDQLWHQRDHYGTPRGEEYASGAAYEGRTNLGNTQPGDGVRFKGRGLIQTTGRANVQRVSDYFGVDFVSNPQLLNDPQWSALTAGLYWQDHNLNALADQATDASFVSITRAINGGTSGLDQRRAFYATALDVLARSPAGPAAPPVIYVPPGPMPDDAEGV